jgi:hypothetical protein
MEVGSLDQRVTVWRRSPAVSPSFTWRRRRREVGSSNEDEGRRKLADLRLGVWRQLTTVSAYFTSATMTEEAGSGNDDEGRREVACRRRGVRRVQDEGRGGRGTAS